VEPSIWELVGMKINMFNIVHEATGPFETTRLARTGVQAEAVIQSQSF
jgi:hypothetical protein